MHSMQTFTVAVQQHFGSQKLGRLGLELGWAMTAAACSMIRSADLVELLSDTDDSPTASRLPEDSRKLYERPYG